MKTLFNTFLCLLLAVQTHNAWAIGVTPSAELLMWNASEEPSSFWAITSTLTEDKIDIDNNDFGWSPGFRAGLSLEPNAYFDTTVYWTYFSTDSSSQVPIAAHIVAPEFFSGYLSKNFFFGAQQDWRLTMNAVNIEAGHTFNIGENISLHPTLGLMGASINQDIDVLWQAELYNAKEKVASDFLGFGPTFGIHGEWKFVDHFSFVGNFSTAFLWGNWNISDVYSRPYVALSLTPEATVITTKMNDDDLGTLVLKYFLGIQWTTESLSNMSIQLGYEMQYWPNQLRLTVFQQLPIRGDLTFQGGTCRISLDF